MRGFYLAWTEGQAKLQQAVGELGRARNLQQAVGEIDGEAAAGVAEIPWGHNISLIEKLKDPAERLWYARQATEQGWSRAVLVHQIETDLYRRQGRAITNFTARSPRRIRTWPSRRSRTPTASGSSTVADARERDLERGLVARIREFLLELGVGFAFVGQPVPPGGRRARLLHRSALLPPQTALLRRDRPEDEASSPSSPAR